jgi:hypothetical protein
VPTEDGVGSNERRNLGEGASADGLLPHGQSASLIICQAKSTAAELLFQDAVLFAEVLDDCILLTGDPAGQGGNEDLPRLNCNGHRQLSASVETA